MIATGSDNNKTPNIRLRTPINFPNNDFGT